MTNSDPGDDGITGNGEEGTTDSAEEENEIEGGFQESSDEIARIYWKLFSSIGSFIEERITTRDELLPRCGKLKR
jgi:hypothetical protein